MQTYYHILNITPDAGDDDVRRAYHALALRWHPDRNPQARAQAEAMLAPINHAYSMLRTAPQRRAYNRHLTQFTASVPVMRPAAVAPASVKKKHPAVALLSGLFEILWPFNFRKEIRHG